MRVLVEPSDYILRNFGDMAMMHIALTRIKKLWPNAFIQVLTDAPHELCAFIPGIHPLCAQGKRDWIRTRVSCPHEHRRLRHSIHRIYRRLGTDLRRIWSKTSKGASPSPSREAVSDYSGFNGFLDAVTGADLVLTTGMGGITDAFPQYASELLSTLHLATQCGATTALVGQGIGPLTLPELRSQARQVLPRVNFIALREQCCGRPLLESLGVPSGRIITTGDDAIETAYSRRPPTMGIGLGINLRAANYAQVDDTLVDQLKPVLHDAAASLGAPILPVPISLVPGEEDAATIARLLGSSDGAQDDGSGLGTFTSVIDQIGRCRVVVTGSYHAGVFSLSQGVSVVALANSDYYFDKFAGLAEQFGCGCRTIALNNSSWKQSLPAAIRQAWSEAGDLRQRLLDAACRQVECGHAVYRLLYDLVQSRERRRRGLLTLVRLRRIRSRMLPISSSPRTSLDGHCIQAQP